MLLLDTLLLVSVFEQLFTLNANCEEFKLQCVFFIAYLCNLLSV